MEERIRHVLESHGRLARPVSSLQPDHDLYDAGMTSHASVNVMLALEDEFDLEFPESALRRETFASITAISDAIQGLTAGVEATQGAH